MYTSNPNATALYAIATLQISISNSLAVAIRAYILRDRLDRSVFRSVHNFRANATPNT
jgi:hypothetical protein